MSLDLFIPLSHLRHVNDICVSASVLGKRPYDGDVLFPHSHRQYFALHLLLYQY